MTSEFYLCVKTDQYTGNWDSFLMGLLFDYDDDRYGYKAGTRKHIGFPADNPEILGRHPDASHDLPYAMEGPACHELVIALDAPLSRTQMDHLATYYRNKSFSDEAQFITILGFEHRVVTVVKRTTVEPF